MNPIANLPATQNVNRPQQTQGYSRQYFGSDEFDEVVLSNQEEQKKKKAWTIGGAILGTLALVGGTLFGLNVYGKIGKDASHLKGFKQLTNGEGDKAKKLASIAKTDKSFTGATWSGVASTISSTLEGKNKNKFDKVVLVATEDSQDKLKASLGEELFKKLTVIKANSDKIEDAAKEAKKYGENEKNLIIADSTVDNLYEKIMEAIVPSSDGADKKEEAKKEETTPAANNTTTTETSETTTPAANNTTTQANSKILKAFGIELDKLGEGDNAEKLHKELEKAKDHTFESITLATPEDINTVNTTYQKQTKFIKEFNAAQKALTEHYQKEIDAQQKAQKEATNKFTELETKKSEILDNSNESKQKFKSYLEEQGKAKTDLATANSKEKEVIANKAAIEKYSLDITTYDANKNTITAVSTTLDSANNRLKLFSATLTNIENLEKEENTAQSNYEKAQKNPKISKTKLQNYEKKYKTAQTEVALAKLNYEIQKEAFISLIKEIKDEEVETLNQQNLQNKEIDISNLEKACEYVEVKKA